MTDLLGRYDSFFSRCDEKDTVMPEAALAAIRYLLKSFAHSKILFQEVNLFRRYRLGGRYDRFIGPV